MYMNDTDILIVIVIISSDDCRDVGQWKWQCVFMLTLRGPGGASNQLTTSNCVLFYSYRSGLMSFLVQYR